MHRMNYLTTNKTYTFKTSKYYLQKNQKINPYFDKNQKQNPKPLKKIQLDNQIGYKKCYSTISTKMKIVKFVKTMLNR